MFGKSSKVTAVQSIIGTGTMIVGDISFEGGLRIDGMVKGNIQSIEGVPNMLHISEQAKIDGEIHAAHLIIAGTVNGPVYATKLIELLPKARVKGDVMYNAIEMHHGAIVSGMLKHHAHEDSLLLSDTNLSNKPDNKK
jgi:cytoskeletal protein CcmA (bactofilin family)